jgi:hypothetical protein
MNNLAHAPAQKAHAKLRAMRAVVGSTEPPQPKQPIAKRLILTADQHRNATLEPGSQRENLRLRVYSLLANGA